MKDLGKKSYVLSQLRGTIEIAKSWFRKRLNLSRPYTASSPPSDGRGTQVVEATGIEIQRAANRLRHGNFNRREYAIFTRSNLKLSAGSTSASTLVNTTQSHRNLSSVGTGTSRIQSWLKGKKIRQNVSWIQSHPSWTDAEHSLL